MIDWSLVPRRREIRQLGGRVPWFNGWGASSIAVDPRGRWFLTGGERGLRLFEAASGELVRTFDGRGNDGTTYERIGFSADGARAFAHFGGAGSDKTAIGVWEVEGGALLRTLDASGGGRITAIDRDGRRALARSANADSILWDLERETMRLLKPRPYGGLSAAAFLSPTSAIASNGRSGAFLWNLETSAVVWENPIGVVFTLAAPADGAWFAAGGDDGAVRVYDSATGDRQYELRTEHSGSILSLDVAADGSHIACTIGDRLVVWNVTSRKPVLLQTTEDGCAIAFSPSGAWIAGAGPSGQLWRFDLAGGGEKPSISSPPIHRGAINRLEFLDDGEILSRDSREITLQWSESGEARPTTRELSLGATRLAPPWLPDLRHAIDREISRQDGGGEVVTVVAQTLAATLIFGNGVVIFDLAQSPDRPLHDLYVGSAPGSHTLSAARAIALHPDGRRIAIGSTRADAPLQLWDARTGMPLAILEGHEVTVESVAFNADGTLLASGSADRTVRIWRIE